MDASPLALTSGGLRRYTEELAQALQSLGETVSLMAPEGRLWWSLKLPWRLRTGHDVFHGTNFEVPYMPVVPAVMTVHDVSPWMEHSWHASAARVRRRTPILARLGLAHAIIVPTRAVQSQVAEQFSMRRNRIFVVPDGAAMQRVDVPAPEKPYFLFVGTIEPRKNIPALIDAWRPLRDRCDLVIAGRTREDAPALKFEPGLTVAGEVSEHRLRELYSAAIALVYPSLYEGFGLPVVEAMQCGTPVIASRDPALAEVAGDAALLPQTHELTAAMRALLDNEDLRMRLAEAGLRRGSEFSWKRTAQMTVEVYGEAISRARTLS